MLRVLSCMLVVRDTVKCYRKRGSMATNDSQHPYQARGVLLRGPGLAPSWSHDEWDGSPVPRVSNVRPSSVCHKHARNRDRNMNPSMRSSCFRGYQASYPPPEL